MDQLFNYASGIYGGQVLVGANLHLFWWFVAAGFVIITLHALSVPLLARRRKKMMAHIDKIKVKTDEST